MHHHHSAPRGLLSTACLCLNLLGLPAWANPSAPSSPAEPDATLPSIPTRVLAQGLSSPDGLALHPRTGELYVSEETTGRILVLRGGAVVPVVEAGFTVEDSLPAWALTPERPLASWMHPALRNPEGICFTPSGTLLVAEDTPNGRVLEFIPGEDGRFTQARVIPIPWHQDGFAWEQVLAATDGRLFVSGSAAEMGPGVFFGTVLMRDRGGEWWVVDYGPFSSFTGLALTRDEEVLVVGEEVGGAVSWWDTERHEEIGFTQDVLPRVESVATLPDGTLLALQESTIPLGQSLKEGGRENHSGRLVRIHPETGSIQEIARGFASLEGMVYHAASGRLWLTEDGSGRVLELQPGFVLNDHDVLSRSQHTREVNQGRGPRKWPTFLRDFIQNLGVQPIDEDAQTLFGLRGNGGADLESSRPLTLQEFAEKIPFVAGKLKVDKAVGPVGRDPLKEVSFVLFYPNQGVRSSQGSSPSLSLFSATYESGRVERSREMMGRTSTTFRAGERAAVAAPSGPASLFLPLASANVIQEKGSTRMTLSFLGVDILDDYLLALNIGGNESGFLTLNLRQGGKETYEVSFVEKDETGALKRNQVVAGLDRGSSKNYGWYKLGGSGTTGLLTLSPMEMPFETRRTQDLVKLIQDRQREWQLAMGVQPEESFLFASAPAKPKVNTYTPEIITADYRPRPKANATEAAALEARRPESELRADKPGEGQRAEPKANQLRVDKPGSEERVEPKSGDQRAEPSQSPRQAQATKPTEGTVLLSKAVEAWNQTTTVK